MERYRGWRAKAVRRMLRANVKPTRYQRPKGRCRLYALDGKAYLVSKRRVVLLADWFEYCQHKRRIA